MTVRVYLPSTVRRLAAMLDAGRTTPVSGIGFAVTAELAATSAVSTEISTSASTSASAAADDEELEYLAMRDAARASLRLLIGDPEPARRVVLAAAVPAVRERDDLDRAAVEVSGDVSWSAVAAVHIDAEDAEGAVRDAVDAVVAADLGDLDADFVVGTAEDLELAWYAPSEVRYRVAELI